MAYLILQVKKDTATAKPYFEKYIAMYPDGCNPYDSMGEFYLIPATLRMLKNIIRWRWKNIRLI